MQDDRCVVITARVQTVRTLVIFGANVDEPNLLAKGVGVGQQSVADGGVPRAIELDAVCP